MSKKIIDLTQLTTPASDDILAIRDTSAGSTKKITVGDLFNNTSSKVVFSGARVKRATGQTGILASTLTTIAWTGEDFDVGGYHDNVTNNSRVTAPATGFYTLGVHIEWDAWDSTATPYRLIISLYKNGILYCENLDTHVSNNGGETAWIITDFVSATAGDYFEWRVFQGTPNTRTLITNTYAWIKYEGS